MRWLVRAHVVLKPVVSDPQGEAIRGGLHSLGYEAVEQVRGGKYFEILIEAGSQKGAEQQANEMCRRLLANPVIEDYWFEVAVAMEPKDAG
jgi:phosphoribosylformylglycinamidine synthase